MQLDQFGLTAQPFQLSPDPRFWFESATHKKAMAYLGYGLQQGEGFVVITGEIGAGKTTLVGHLMSRLDPARVNAIHLVSTHLDRDDLVRAIAHGFGMDSAGQSKAALIASIEEALITRSHAGQRTLVIVDEVQNLPQDSLEELRMLSNFQGAGPAMLQFLLLGQPEFRDCLSAPELEQLSQRVIANHHLTAMGPVEVGAYINHRMALVGWQGVPQFAPDAVSEIFQQSGGIPRKVNQIASRALLMAALEQSPIIDGRIIALVKAEMNVDVPQKAEEALTAIVKAPESSESTARMAQLEAQVAEQDEALRRVLTLLVDWIEGEAPLVQVGAQKSAPAA